MFAVPKFTIYDDQPVPEGVFDWRDSRDEIFDRYYEAQDLLYLGDIDRARTIVKKIVDEDPHFIHGFRLLGDLELERGKFQQALKHHKKAVEIGEKLIPDDFNGKIRWGFTENQPFLTALNTYGQDLLDQGKFEEAVPLFERILNYNPEDNQGIRLLIGDLYFVTGDTGKAVKRPTRRTLTTHPTSTATACYSSAAATTAGRPSFSARESSPTSTFLTCFAASCLSLNTRSVTIPTLKRPKRLTPISIPCQINGPTIPKPLTC
ncbi:MAG: tetratricopeptide repeat protein [Balneolaceae bacterium]|nr:tetratricopeptide repeat protein [Balneolaceae bacterium]